jgi:hypothetical protein
MGENRVIRGASRLALVLALVSMSACLKDDSGSGASQTGLGAATPVIWVDQSAPTAASIGVPGDSPLNWIDATTVTATGVGAILPSTDEVTYGFPRPLLPVGNPSLTHPLQTNSNAAAVLNPEDQLAQAINTYRQVSAGFGGVGGIGGIGGIGGGVGQVGTVMLPMSNKLRKNARAHCKHYGAYHPGAFPPGNAANPEGDTIMTGGVAPNGRLPKTGANGQPNPFVGGPMAVSVAGAGYPNAQAARDYFVTNNAAQLTTTNANYMGVGHWPAGDQSYYWFVIFGMNPNPVN